MSWLLQLKYEIKGISDSGGYCKQSAYKSQLVGANNVSGQRIQGKDGSCGRTKRRRGSSAQQRSRLSSRKAYATEREWSEYVQL